MRKIKFRCYDKNEGYMLPREHLVDAGDLSEMMKFGHREDNDYSQLMQFTGLTDKNGVEIYEGDIVEKDITGEFFTVEFSEYRGGYFPFAQDDGCGCCSGEVVWNGEDCIVHGNRHENPELLEGSQ